MSGASSRTAILFATPGTTSPEAAAALEKISTRAAQRFPGLERRWTYTSRGIRRKLAARGQSAPGPQDAFSALHAAGFRRVAVLSLHLSDGMEYGELAETVAAHTRGPAAFEGIELSTPLLACTDDFRRACAVLLASLPIAPRAGTAAVLVAHGSKDPQGCRTFASAAALCRQVDPRLLLGVIMGEPSFSDVLQECRAAAVREVWILPFMVAAGQSAHEDIAGPGETSWKSAFERAGIKCTPILKGLGDYDGVVDLWLDHLGCILGHLQKAG